MAAALLFAFFFLVKRWAAERQQLSLPGNEIFPLSSSWPVPPASPSSAFSTTRLAALYSSRPWPGLPQLQCSPHLALAGVTVSPIAAGLLVSRLRRYCIVSLAGSQMLLAGTAPFGDTGHGEHPGPRAAPRSRRR